MEGNMYMTENGEERILHQLNKANEVIHQFITSCSHSMRGPLKSIEGLVNIMRNINSHKDIDPVVMLNLIDKSVNRMEAMLDELEHFMVNSDKKMEIQMVDVKTIAERVKNNFSRELQENNINLTMHIGQSKSFYSDAGRIRLILTNLLDNAIAFQREENSDKRISIKATVTPMHCNIIVEDNGIGIANEEMENIFKMFYRGSNQAKGAGIGLYIVREALEVVGGSISVDSELGHGTLFTISLPNKKGSY